MSVENCRVIYNEEVYKVIDINPFFGEMPNTNSIIKAKSIECIVINMYGEVLIIEDEAHMFKFILDKR